MTTTLMPEAPTVTQDHIKESMIKSMAKPVMDPLPFFFITTVHILALIFAIPTFTWSALAVCVLFHWLTGGVGITLGYHRLLTHQSMKVAAPIKYFCSLMGVLACQGGPISWVTTHRLHHTYSDQEADPHTPTRNFFWAHMEWCIRKNATLKNKDVQNRVVPDLVKDKGLMFLEKTDILWTFLLGLGFYALGGWSFVVWGIFVRLVLVYHATWFVNSAAHVWGYKTYKSDDLSRNLWWVALITYGEGWHNNHHAFQYSARHGLKWWEFDTTYMMIQVLEKLGLASAIKLPPARLLQDKELK